VVSYKRVVGAGAVRLVEGRRVWNSSTRTVKAGTARYPLSGEHNVQVRFSCS
jgi:hypothetical protein